MKINRMYGGQTLRITLRITVLLLLLLLVSCAGAATPISSCTTIDAPGVYVLTNSIVNSGATICINITSGNVTFDGAGYTIDGVNATDTYGVLVRNSTDFTNINIKNLKITDWQDGIYYGYSGYIVFAKNGSISNNTLSSNKYGITVIGGENISLTNNSVSSYIFTQYSWNLILANNNAEIGLSHTSRSNITKNKGGIGLGDSVGNNITANDVSYIGLTYGNRNIIANNKVTNSTGAGIGLSMSENNTIINNSINSNNYGIDLFLSRYNLIINNNISSNNYGINIKEYSSNNLIYNNYFSNVNNALDNGNNIWNTTKTPGTNIIGGPYLGGNFWACPNGTGFSQTCPDNNKDGLCDAQYTLNGNNTDHLPLAAKTATSNLIINPGFESGTSPWIFYTNGKGSFTIVSPGYEGNKAARVAIVDAGNNTQLYQKYITLEPNTQYRLTFAANSTTGHDLKVRLIKHVSPFTRYGLDQTFNISTSWQDFSTEFTTTGFTGTVNDGRLMFYLAPFAKAGDKYYIDNVLLEKI